MKNIYCLFLFLFVGLCATAQHGKHIHHTQHGHVVSATGEALKYAVITNDKDSVLTTTDEHGHFELHLSNGAHLLQCKYLGYKSQKIRFFVRGEMTEPLYIAMESADGNLEDVTVNAKTAIQDVRESAFNVVALDASAQYNTTLDLAHMLNKASGVRIRESAGIGSNVNITLNGFTGRNVKIFMDGVPMEGFGSAFSLNNIPVGIAERIEVYKGVVPIEFGGDAMGGAINIVTRKAKRSYADVSYSFGSFNTHRSNIDLGYTAKSGFTVQLNAFQNYSDNNYRVYSEVLNVETNQYMGYQWVSRFHDTYHNETIIGKIGFVNKKWADRLMLGVTAGQEKADIQQGYVMRIVYGDRARDASTLIPSLHYSKRNFLIKGLNVNVNGTYTRSLNHNYDTANRQYSWNGEYRIKSTAGEGTSSMREYVNKNGSVTTNVSYMPSPKHIFSLNNVYTTFRRKMTDEAIMLDDVSATDTMPSRQSKNVFSGSYQLRYNGHWNTTVFAKYYKQYVTGPVDTSSSASDPKYILRSTNFTTTGYGLATTYLFNTTWQLKASYEKAYRLPTENELFGDGIMEYGSAGLRAENTDNINLGLTYNTQFNEKHGVYADVSFIYRDVKDFIRRNLNNKTGTAVYTNWGRVLNRGVNVDLKYFYKELFSAGGALTYQNITNEERYAVGTINESNVYKDRMPNLPYFFWNTDISLYLRNIMGKGDMLTVSHMMQYIHNFPMVFPSLGTSSSQDRIPTQLSHDITATYSMKNGRYNISFEARNITDRMLYDNFYLQKPGRNFSVKLRYYINKTL